VLIVPLGADTGHTAIAETKKNSMLRLAALLSDIEACRICSCQCTFTVNVMPGRNSPNAEGIYLPRLFPRSVNSCLDYGWMAHVNMK